MIHDVLVARPLILSKLLVGVLTLGMGCNATSPPTPASDDESPGVELPDDGLIPDEDSEPLANAGDDGSTADVVEFELLIAIDGSGTVSPPYNGPVDQDTEVTLAVQPSEGWIFDHWEGDVFGDEPLVTLLMDGPKALIAVFVEDPGPIVPEEPEPRLLDVVVVGNGTILLSPIGSPVFGAVDSSDPDAEIQMGWEYDAGTELELSANPDDDWQFLEWSGGVSSSNSVITITLNEDSSVTATFEFLDGEFSFLSVDDTGLFWSLYDPQLDSIIVWLNDECDLLIQPDCGDVEVVRDLAREDARALAFDVLEAILGEPLAAQHVVEVNSWNFAKYDNWYSSFCGCFNP